MAYIRSLPINDTPEVFGLHENANITFAQNETYSLLKSLLKLQPKSAAGAGKSREEVSTLLNVISIKVYSETCQNQTSVQINPVYKTRKYDWT